MLWTAPSGLFVYQGASLHAGLPSVEVEMLCHRCPAQVCIRGAIPASVPSTPPRAAQTATRPAPLVGLQRSCRRCCGAKMLPAVCHPSPNRHYPGARAVHWESCLSVQAGDCMRFPPFYTTLNYTFKKKTMKNTGNTCRNNCRRRGQLL